MPTAIYKLVYIGGLDNNPDSKNIIESVIKKLQNKGYVKFIYPDYFSILELTEEQKEKNRFLLLDIADIVYFPKEVDFKKSLIARSEKSYAKSKEKKCIVEGIIKCEVEGCDRLAEVHKCGDVCKMHYHRYLRHGMFDSLNDIMSKDAQVRYSAKCKYCDNPVGRQGRRGMCSKHYAMYLKYGDPHHYDNRERKPNSHGYFRKGQQGEHRKIYEDYYGVKLKPTQIVHHIDLNRANNAIENLWLYDNWGEHSKVHRDYERLLKSYPAESIVFDNGKYVLKEDLKNEKA